MYVYAQAYQSLYGISWKGYAACIPVMLLRGIDQSRRQSPRKGMSSSLKQRGLMQSSNVID